MTDALAENITRRELPMGEKIGYGVFRLADVLVMTLAAPVFAILFPLRRKDVDDAHAELERRREEAGAGEIVDK